MNRNPYLRNIIRSITGQSSTIERMDSVTIKITNECNLNCSMCGYARNRKKDQIIQEELDVSEWKRIIDELSGLGVTFISVLGGEPLMYPRLTEILEYMRLKGIQSGITTNGVYLEQYAEQLIKAGLTRINISLDAFPEVHDRIRGVEGTFAAAVKGIQKIHSLRGNENNPKIIANIVVSEENQNILGNYLHYLEQMKEADSIFLVLGTFTTHALGERYAKQAGEEFQCRAESWRGFADCLGDIDIKEVTRIYNLVKSNEYKKKITILPPLPSSEDIERYYRHPEETFEWTEKCCWKPWVGVDIRANGDVVVCNDWPDYIVGNARTESMSEIWNGAKIKKIREFILKGKEFAVCNRCPWRFLPSFFLADP
ncbi:MAG TPA: radical SAM protein [Ruminiclostridium sp.]|nr:radical SAM protein [Ruminiclostridium sp.]